MVRTLRITLSLAVFVIWVSAVLIVFRPGTLSALDKGLNRDFASCSSGDCRCSVSNTGCHCNAEGGVCGAYCDSGQSSMCWPE